MNMEIPSYAAPQVRSLQNFCLEVVYLCPRMTDNLRYIYLVGAELHTIFQLFFVWFNMGKPFIEMFYNSGSLPANKGCAFFLLTYIVLCLFPSHFLYSVWK